MPSPSHLSRLLQDSVNSVSPDDCYRCVTESESQNMTKASNPSVSKGFGGGGAPEVRAGAADRYDPMPSR